MDVIALFSKPFPSLMRAGKGHQEDREHLNESERDYKGYAGMKSEVSKQKVK